MIYSNSPLLISLYAQYNFNNGYSEDDYINISKYKKGNESLIFAILNANWLLKLEDLENKDEEELEYERFCLQSKIDDMKKKLDSSNFESLSNSIKLFEYQLECLDEYIQSKTNEYQDVKKSTKRILTFAK